MRKERKKYAWKHHFPPPHGTHLNAFVRTYPSNSDHKNFKDLLAKYFQVRVLFLDQCSNLEG